MLFIIRNWSDAENGIRKTRQAPYYGLAVGISGSAANRHQLLGYEARVG